MIPWELLDSASMPGERAELQLWRRDTEFSIRLGNCEVMNSRLHGSEDALAEIACKRVGKRPNARVLIGGLGLGFTLAAALRYLGRDGEAVVAEIVPAVVKWNRETVGDVAGQPLKDKRVTVREDDVGKLIRAEKDAYDTILLDVDNGPDGLLRDGNVGIYTPTGLRAIYQALRPRGVLGVWSVGPCRAFTYRLRRAGFFVEEVPARIREGRGGRRHMLWIATRLKEEVAPPPPPPKRVARKRSKWAT